MLDNTIDRKYLSARKMDVTKLISEMNKKKYTTNLVNGFEVYNGFYFLTKEKLEQLMFRIDQELDQREVYIGLFYHSKMIGFAFIDRVGENVSSIVEFEIDKEYQNLGLSEELALAIKKYIKKDDLYSTPFTNSAKEHHLQQTFEKVFEEQYFGLEDNYLHKIK